MKFLPLTMQSVISFCKDPETVAKFQRLCGIVVVASNACHPTSSDASMCRGELQAHYTSSEDSRGEVCKQRSMDASNNGSLKTVKCPSKETSDNGYIITNKILYYLFHFGANLGNEIFYMTFMPFWFWNIDGCVGRQLLTFWCIFMYVGQAMKDVIRIPRPKSPPVVQLEKRYALEYGMPSTHAMVGAGIPFAIFFLTKERYIYPSELALVGAIVWCTVVCVSRIYLGMHTILDVLVGLALISALMVCFLPYLGAIDDFLLHSECAPIVCILVPLTLAIMYPTPCEMNTTRRDTTYILAAGSGITLGHWLSYQCGFMVKASTPPPYDIIPPTWTWVGLVMVRMTVGVAVLLCVRFIVSKLTYRLACLMAGIDHRNVEVTKRHTVIDMSHKYITYATLAIGMVFAPPMLFSVLGIERETFFTEI